MNVVNFISRTSRTQVKVAISWLHKVLSIQTKDHKSFRKGMAMIRMYRMAANHLKKETPGRQTNRISVTYYYDVHFLLKRNPDDLLTFQPAFYISTSL